MSTTRGSCVSFLLIGDPVGTDVTAMRCTCGRIQPVNARSRNLAGELLAKFDESERTPR